MATVAGDTMRSNSSTIASASIGASCSGMFNASSPATASAAGATRRSCNDAR
jgi:hypothetical protein